MANEYVSLKELAAELGMDRSHARRYVLNLGITPAKRRTGRTPSRSSPGLAPTPATFMGLFNAGWPWERDYLLGRRSRVPFIKIWAYDHLCLFGRGVPLPSEDRTHRL